jgi:hypothetical protein
MSAYTGLTAPQLLSLLAAKRKEEDELIAALTAAISGVRAPAAKPAGAKAAAKAKSAGAAADSSSTSSGRSRTAWNAWVAQLKTLYPGEVQAFVAAKHGSPIEFASTKKKADVERYAAFVAAWKAAGTSADADSQAARAVTVEDEEDDDAGSVASAPSLEDAEEGDASDEEEASPPPPLAPLVRKAGGGGSKVAAAPAPAAVAVAAPAPAPVPAPAPAPAPKASTAAPVPKPKRKAPAPPTTPKPVTRWMSPEGLEYFRNEDGQLWEVTAEEDGSMTVGEWAGVVNLSTGEIDSDAKAPATPPTLA